MSSRLVQGIGINDADYFVSRSTKQNGVNKIHWMCPYYDRWRFMLKRCYSEKHISKHPTYQDATVSDDWLRFSVFKEWMEDQPWKNNELDKDILQPGSKVYSSENCVFIPKIVNTFILDCSKARGQYPIGVCFDKERGLYKAECCNPFTKKCEYLGRFKTPEEAHEAWRDRKHELAMQLANSEFVQDDRVAYALSQRYAA